MGQKINGPVTLGVDLGGTKVKVGLVDSKGCLLSVHKSPIHSEKKPNRVIADVLTGIDHCLSKANLEAQALGVGIAAQVNLNGVVHGSPNLGWSNVPLKKMLEEKLGMPMIVTNDVRAATFGEWRYGSGKGVDDLAVLFVGTGIGGGIISGGNLLGGCTNTAGELGHTIIVVEGRKCHCLNKGCLEAYAGGWAIAKRAQEAVNRETKKGRLLISLARNVEKITAATVSQAYRQGDPLACRLVKETGQYLAAGAVNIVNAFNPCRLVLGGGVIEGIPELVQMVEDYTRKRALGAAVEKFEILRTAMGDDAGVIGAAALAQDLINKTR
jgi:glucokinase